MAAKKKAAKKTAAKKTAAPKKTAAVAATTAAITETTAAPVVLVLSGLAEKLMKAAAKGKTPMTPYVSGEPFGPFAERLCESLATVEENDFNKLPAEARKWFDDAVDPINGKELDKVPALDGFPAASTAAAEAPKTDAPKAEAKSKGDAPKEPKAPKEKKPKAEKTPRGPRLGVQIAEMVAKNNKLSFEQLCDRLDVEGKKGGKKVAHDEGSYVYARWEEAKHCVKVMGEK